MDIIRVSTKGQIVIPKGVREAHQWEAGQELLLVDTPEGVFIKAKPREGAVTVADVAGCLSKYRKPHPVSVEEMDAAIAQHIRDSSR